MGALLQEDQSRYRQMHEKMPAFQKYYRPSQECTFKPLQLVYRFLLRHSRKRSLVELMYTCHIGGGLYLGASLLHHYQSECPYRCQRFNPPRSSHWTGK